jgi:hypothetical protein
MRRLSLTCALLLAAFFNGQGLRAQADSASFRSILRQRYAQQDSAIARRDLPLFLSTLAPSYDVELRDGQRFTRPQIDSAIARDMRLTRAVTLVTTVVDSVWTLRDTIWASVVHRTDRLLADAQGRPHRWESAVRHQEGWMRQASEWRIVALREREQLHLRRDGVPIH